MAVLLNWDRPAARDGRAINTTARAPRAGEQGEVVEAEPPVKKPEWRRTRKSIGRLASRNSVGCAA